MKKNWKSEVGGNEPGQVYPLNDTRKHCTHGLDCWCDPVILYVDEKTGVPYEYPIVVHSSEDQRELIEEAEEIKNRT